MDNEKAPPPCLECGASGIKDLLWDGEKVIKVYCPECNGQGKVQPKDK